MRRVLDAELLERGGVPEDLVERAYRELTRIHRFLGDTACVVSAVRSDPLPVKRVLDIGCAGGGVLLDVANQLCVEVVGVDLNLPVRSDAKIPIVRANAVRDSLPAADVAFSMYLGHHLTEHDLIGLIRNVGRHCRRFILLDLVRHPLPLVLFRLFIAPFVSRIVVADGLLSIRRAYTPAELGKLTGEALAGTGAQFRHSVAPFYMRQVLDISYS